jgi:hypothetical protein
MTKFNALMLSLVFGIIFFTILNANHSFAQLFQPGAQDKLLLPNTHQNKKEGASPNTIIDQNKAPPATTTITLLYTNNTCNNNDRNHNSC